MNEFIHDEVGSAAPRLNNGTLVRVPDMPLHEDGEQAVPAAGTAAHMPAMTDPRRDTRNEWIEGARCTVRGSPLATVAAAVALGAVIARLIR